MRLARGFDSLRPRPHSGSGRATMVPRRLRRGAWNSRLRRTCVRTWSRDAMEEVRQTPRPAQRARDTAAGRKPQARGVGHGDVRGGAAELRSGGGAGLPQRGRDVGVRAVHVPLLVDGPAGDPARRPPHPPHQRHGGVGFDANGDGGPGPGGVGGGGAAVGPAGARPERGTASSMPRMRCSSTSASGWTSTTTGSGSRGNC